MENKDVIKLIKRSNLFRYDPTQEELPDYYRLIGVMSKHEILLAIQNRDSKIFQYLEKISKKNLKDKRPISELVSMPQFLIKQADWVFTDIEFCLFPENEFKNEMLNEYLNQIFFLHQHHAFIEDTLEWFEDKIKIVSILNNSDVKFISQLVPAYNILNYAQLLILEAQEQNDSTNLIMLSVLKNHYQLLVVKGGKIQIVTQRSFQTGNEILYMLNFLIDSIKITPFETIKVMLYGEIQTGIKDVIKTNPEIFHVVSHSHSYTQFDVFYVEDFLSLIVLEQFSKIYK